MKKKDISFTEKQMELASKLTPLQRKFIIELIKPNTSQRQAYVRAGGKSATTEAQDAAASRMLSDVRVKAFYESMLETKTIYSLMERDEAIDILSKQARINITDVCEFKNVKVGEDEDGNPVYQTVWTIKNSEDILPNIAASIKSVTVTNQGPKIELHNQADAIKQLREMLGWNSATKHQITGELEVTSITRKIIK